MSPLGPFAAGRPVVVGVSGGADSMALAFLLRRWGDPLAVVVDHGLRPESAAEAALTLERLESMGVPARAVRLHIHGGADLGARARSARYQALFSACVASGRADLAVGHHAADQVEGIVLRRRSGSGAAGLAGMASVGWRGAGRLLRPLLPVAPGRLRATLQAAGIAWVEDPGNHDRATARGALRHEALPSQPEAGTGRRILETAVASELARTVTVFSTGHAKVDGNLCAAGWSALLWTVSGRPYPPPSGALLELIKRGGGTLHGVVVSRGLVTREPAAMAPEVAAHVNAEWDERFTLRQEAAGATMGALGSEAAALRRRPGLPAAVLRTLPAIRRNGKLLAVPHLAYPDAETCLSFPVEFRPARPLAGAPFRP